MKWVKRILFGLGLLVAAFVAIAFLLPSESNVSRSVVINAPVAKVFPLVNSLRSFYQWSPWSGIDPDMKVVFSGPESGKGARAVWTSKDPSVGNGSQVITESVENKRVTIALDFGDMGKATAAYVLRPEGQNTRVTWLFHTELGNNPVMRWMGLMFDKMVGDDYERGLARLKGLAEK